MFHVCSCLFANSRVSGASDVQQAFPSSGQVPSAKSSVVDAEPSPEVVASPNEAGSKRISTYFNLKFQNKFYQVHPNPIYALYHVCKPMHIDSNESL